jgi:hypothetical protein
MIKLLIKNATDMIAPTTEGIYIVKNDPANGKYYKKPLVKN